MTQKHYKKKKTEQIDKLDPTLVHNIQGNDGNTLQLFHADALSMLGTIADKSIDLVVIDPPYNVLRGKHAAWDNFRDDVYLDFMSNILAECSRVLKDNGQLYMWHNDFKQIAELMTKKHGALGYGGMVIWDKESARAQAWKNVKETNTLRSWFSTVEFCLHYVQNKDKDSSGLLDILHDPKNFQRNRQYSAKILQHIGKSSGQMIKIHGGCVAHFFVITARQYGMCSKETYDMLTETYKLEEMDGYLTYEQLKDMYAEDREAYYAERDWDQIQENRYAFNTGIYPEYNNVWRTQERNTGKLHPTQKPVDLHEKLIQTSSRTGAVVLDVFMGSGTTAVACATTGRNFVGCDMSGQYVDVARDRVCEALAANRKAQPFSTMQYKVPKGKGKQQVAGDADADADADGAED